MGMADVPAYYRDLRAHFEATEPELWQWFTDVVTPDPKAEDEAEVELLKTAYRLSGTTHDVLAAEATMLSGALELDVEVVLYQELGTNGRNATVRILGDTAHVVFSGELLDLLSPAEAKAVLAHELVHVDLWRRDDRAWLVLDQLVHRLAAGGGSHEALVETARRLRLHTEVHADTRALQVTADRRAMIAALVKVHAGLRTVDPEAYLRQAEEILESDPAATRAWTHPELHIRVACLAAGAESGNTVDILVNGADDLDRLDVLGQSRLQQTTADVLAAGIAAVPDDDVRSRLADAYHGIPAASPDSLADDALAESEPSVRHLAAALLVDVALADPNADDSLADLRALAFEADRIGVGTEFDRVLAKATDHTADQLKKLRSAS